METLTIYHVEIIFKVVEYLRPTHQTHIEELFNISS
jgi:hypothetical protein